MRDDINSEALKTDLNPLKLSVMVAQQTSSQTMADLRLAKNVNYSTWDIVHEILSGAVEETVVSGFNSPLYSTMAGDFADDRPFKHLAACESYISANGDIKIA